MTLRDRIKVNVALRAPESPKRSETFGVLSKIMEALQEIRALDRDRPPGMTGDPGPPAVDVTYQINPREQTDE